MGVPILMYHEVDPRDTVAERYTVTTQRFREHMMHLRDEGYQTLSLEQYRRQLSSGAKAATAKQIIITFDDNHISHYSICTPILKELGLTATFFIVSSFLDTTPDLLTRSQLREMKQAGMSIESHSHTHRFLDDLSDVDLQDELATSRRVLEESVGAEVRYISCPGGRYDGRTLDGAPRVGYHGVCTSVPGLNPSVSNRWPKALYRFLISATTSVDTFAKIAGGERNYVRREVFRDRAKTTIKAVLGNKLYHTLWQRYRRDMRE